MDFKINIAVNFLPLWGEEIQKKKMNDEKKIRLTNQRLVIIEELRKVTSHPTAYDIYQMVRKRLPRISLGTVYRNLDFLVSYGLIQQLEMKGSQKRYDGNPSPHYHIRCINCGRIDDIAMPVRNEFEEAAGKASGFKIVGHHLEFIGICIQCQSSNP